MPTSFSIWISAFRPRTLALALACIGTGLSLAAADGFFCPLVAVLAVLTATLLQILSNLANDYGDSKHGADSKHRAGPKRAVQSGQVSAAHMKQAMYLAAGAAMVSGIALVVSAFGMAGLAWLVGFMALGGLAIWAAIAYTATEKPYGYAGLGDLMVFVFFGWVAVLGSYFLQAQQLPSQVWLPACTLGLFSVAVLNVNNVRDLESDKLAGKRSIPVRIGARNARIYHWLLVILAIGLSVFYVTNYAGSAWKWLFLLACPLPLLNALKLWQARTPAQADPLLKMMALSTLLFALLLGIGVNLAR
jgi:1,4-dihydroxy-2-naphthoate octaprenyltransferase